MKPRDHSQSVIWATIAVIALYLASQYQGPLPAIFAPAPAPAPRPKRHLFPIFPRHPRD